MSAAPHEPAGDGRSPGRGPDDGQAAGTSFDGTTVRAMPTRTVTRVDLLRHGEVVDFERRIVRGQLDVDLTPVGERQHRHLVEWIATWDEPPERIVASDLVRCRRLAEALAERLGRRAELRADLREQSMGAWQGKTWEEITAPDPAAVKDYWEDYVDARPPGGESLRDLYERARAAWLELEPEVRGGRVALVTHVGVIRSLLCCFLGVPPGEALRFAPAAGSCTRVLLSDSGAVLTTLGERPWLFSKAFGGAEGPARGDAP